MYFQGNAEVHSLSISGYHMHEAVPLVQELGFTLADGREYVRAAIRNGLDVDDFAGRLSSSSPSKLMGGLGHLTHFFECTRFESRSTGTEIPASSPEMCWSSLCRLEESSVNTIKCYRFPASEQEHCSGSPRNPLMPQ